MNRRSKSAKTKKVVKKTVVKKIVKKNVTNSAESKLKKTGLSATLSSSSSSSTGLALKKGKLFSAVRKVMHMQTTVNTPVKRVMFAMLETEAEVQARLEAEAANASKLSLRTILWATVAGQLLMSSVKQFAKKKRVKRTAKFIEIYQNNREVYI